MYIGCEVIDRNRQIVRCENGKRVVVNNPQRKEIGVVQIDDCVIKDTKRCDLMFRLPDSNKLEDGIRCIKLVELKGKGSNVEHAFKQIDETLKHISMSTEKHLVDECFIVTQLKPSFLTLIQVNRVQFEDEHGIPVRVVHEATIEADCPLH